MSDEVPDTTPEIPQARTPLHRLMGYLMVLNFEASPFEVEGEQDLARKKQLLDYVLIRRGSGNPPNPIADGFDNLADHTLISFKSSQESFDEFALRELIGHSVNYENLHESKDYSFKKNPLLMIALTTHYPRNILDDKNVVKKELHPGVFETFHGVIPIRFIVINRLKKESRNAWLLLFSSLDDLVEYGREHTDISETDLSSVLNSLFGIAPEEGMVITPEQARMGIVFEYLDSPLVRAFIKAAPEDKVVQLLESQGSLDRIPPQNLLEKALEKDALKEAPSEKLFERLSPKQQEEMYQLYLEKQKKTTDDN